jgi:perosamine synthetase
MKIPWAIPDFQDKDKKAVLRVLRSNWLSMGSEVKSFEKNISSYLNIKYSIAVNNGTSALDTALKCLGIKRRDEVIIPALTYIATGNAILYNQGTPIFVDIDDTLNINTSLIKEKITDRTKAIINIDLGGNVSNYKELTRISKEYDVPLVVDGAQSLGSEYHGVKCCTHGLVNTTSFHTAKPLTTIEGGMVLTEKKDLADKAKAIRNQGETSKYFHEFLGNNYRMTDLVAAIGNSQLRRFNNTLKQRRIKAEYYRKNLMDVEFPRQLTKTISNNFFFLILVNNRDKMNVYLNKHGIETRITYPMPINRQPIFKSYSKEVFPVAEDISQRVISLPIYPQLTLEQQDYIIEKINKFKGRYL